MYLLILLNLFISLKGNKELFSDEIFIDMKNTVRVGRRGRASGVLLSRRFPDLPPETPPPPFHRSGRKRKMRCPGCCCPYGFPGLPPGTSKSGISKKLKESVLRLLALEGTFRMFGKRSRGLHFQRGHVLSAHNEGSSGRSYARSWTRAIFGSISITGVTVLRAS